MGSSIRSSVVVLAVLAAGLVFAASPDAEAKRLALEGKKAFDTQDFPTAIARYNEAYKLKPAPGLLFNLGQCYRKTGELETSLSYFKRYLETNPASAQAKATESVIAEVQGLLDEQRSLDAAEAERARVAEEAAAKAKADAMRVAAAKAEAEAAQQKLQLELTRRKELEAAPQPVTSKWWFWATVVGVVAAGATIGTVAAASPRPVQTSFPDINAR